VTGPLTAIDPRCNGIRALLEQPLAFANRDGIRAAAIG
jgi:hypothetical protein